MMSADLWIRGRDTDGAKRRVEEPVKKEDEDTEEGDEEEDIERDLNAVAMLKPMHRAMVGWLVFGEDCER